MDNRRILQEVPEEQRNFGLGSGGSNGGISGMSKTVLGAFSFIVIMVLLSAWVWLYWMIEVPPEHVAVLFRKTGKVLPEGVIVAPSEEYKGIQINTLKEGTHFLNPYTWDWKIMKQIIIPEGRSGILVRNYGDEPKDNGFIAENETEKGILRDVLTPGRYAQYNPYTYDVKLFPALTIDPGHVGVVTLRYGKDPKERNTFLVEKGERGVQKVTLEAGTYYYNPFVREISIVSIQANRYDLEGALNSISFPSKDSFDINLEGTIEWAIDKDMVPIVYMKYNDEESDEFIDKIVRKIILPNARSLCRIRGSKYLGKEFISGHTRRTIQTEIEKDLIEACKREGILIKKAMVNKISPPARVARVLQDREIAIRENEKFEKEKETQIAEKNLAEQRLMIERSKLQNESEARVSVATLDAKKEAEVKIIQVEQKKEVAERTLLMAKNQAEAVVAKAQAEAEVIKLSNLAEANAIKDAVNSFGGGKDYARYAMLKKIAPSFGGILDNTTGVFSKVFSGFISDEKGGNE